MELLRVIVLCGRRLFSGFNPWRRQTPFCTNWLLKIRPPQAFYLGRLNAGGIVIHKTVTIRWRVARNNKSLLQRGTVTDGQITWSFIHTLKWVHKRWRDSIRNMNIKGSARQGWMVDWATTDLQNGSTNGDVICTPLPIKLLSLVSPSCHLD